MILYAISAMIALISSLNIINTINTNLLVRSNEFGLLMVVGTTNEQLKMITILEGIFYALISSIIGTCIGLTAQHLIMNHIDGIIFNIVPFSNIITAWIVTLFICVISSYIPLRKISKVSPTTLVKIIQ